MLNATFRDSNGNKEIENKKKEEHVLKQNQNSECAAPSLTDFFAVITQHMLSNLFKIVVSLTANIGTFDFIGNTHTESYFGYFQVFKHYMYVFFYSKVSIKLIDLLFLRCHNICWRTG